MRRPVAQAREALGVNKVGALDDNGSPTLTARVFALMRSDILELRLEPGSKLVLDELRDKYEAGASPLRESLSRLAVEGLVTGEDRRGFRVAPLTEDDFIDLTTLRKEIEVLAVTRSVERGNDMWEADLLRAFHHMSLATPTPGGLGEWPGRHQAFHEALVAACGSPRLLHLRRQLFDQFTRYQRIAPRHVWRSAGNDTEHKKMLDAALARDTKKCEALILAHIKVLDVILEAVRALNGKSKPSGKKRD
jgi:GntR family transcriptional regulator, carbon starvation induced regulator